MQTIATKKSWFMPFIPRTGEMAELIVEHDWSETSLGNPETWPQSLKTTLSIMLNSKFPTVVFWGKDLVCFYNDAFRPSLGVEGKHPWSLGKKGEEMWAEIWPIIKPWLDQVLKGGESIWMENQLVPFYRNGRIEDIYWTFCYNAIYDETARAAGVFVTCTETTQEILSKKKLRESDLFARNIIMNSEAAQAVWAGEDFVFEIANEKMLEYMGKDQSIIGKPLMEVMPELRNSDLVNRLQSVLASGKTYYEPEQMFLLNVRGKPVKRYFNYSYKVLQNSEGKNYAILCTSVDVTDQVLSRKKLEESEQNFRNLVMQAPVGICIVKGTDPKVEMVNDQFLALVGRQRSEVEFRAYWDVLPEAADAYRDILKNVFETGVEYTGTEHRVLLMRSGREEIVYVTFVYEPIKNETEGIERVMILAIDVTAQMLARIEIEESRLREKLAIDVSQLGVFDIDLVKREVIASARLDEIFGLNDKPGKSDMDRFLHIIHPDDLQRRVDAYERSFKTGIFKFEGRIIHQDGSIRWIRSRGTVVYDADKQPQRLIGVTQDITEQKEFEDELNKKVAERTLELQQKNAELERSNQKLEEFAHAASHDLKEPMRKIHFFIDRLKNQLAERMKEDEKFTFSRIEASTKRMVSIVDDMLQYSHVSHAPPEKEDIDLNKKLQIVLEDLELDIKKKNAVIEIDALPSIKGYRRQLQQLFQNLISNSLKYAKQDVPPHIHISSKKIDTQDFPGLIDQSDSNAYHLIEVADNGIGFEQEYGEDIFKLFYRLHQREQYGGTGIGLAIARKVVENHNGKIIAEGKPGEGTTFKIFFPAE